MDEFVSARPFDIESGHEPGRSAETSVPLAPNSWSMLPIAFLRQAGFPRSDLDVLRAPTLVAAVRVREATAVKIRTAAAELRTALPRSTSYTRISTRLGQGQQLRKRDAQVLRDNSTTHAAFERWTSALECHAEADAAFRAEFEDRLHANRLAVVEAFQDDALRQVLLLSNDDRFDFFARWLDGKPRVFEGSARQRVDTLARYWQRVCTKNETHSHFGPFTPARTGSNTGMTWTAARHPVRRAFLAYWAAQEVANVAVANPALRDRTCPRRDPLTFLEPGRIARYTFEAEESPDDYHGWRFRKVDERIIGAAEHWILAHSDGATSLARLRALFPARTASTDPADKTADKTFDELVDELEERGWIRSGFEIPTGTRSPSADLRALLPRDLDAARECVSFLDRTAGLLRQFEPAVGQERPALLAELKAEFTKFTGTTTNRGQGQIYADRSVVFEECRSGIEDLRIGREITSFITDELSLVYDLMLIGPRLRMQRESAILHAWCRERYRPDAEIPIVTFYEDFFAHIDPLSRACAVVDREVTAATRHVATVLIPPGPSPHRVQADTHTIRALVDTYGRWPSAVLNPDVMFVAGEPDAFRTGRFGAVIGDCHAVRDLLTHTSVAPLLSDEHPDLAEHVAAGYATLVDDDEMVVDLVRRHLSKTSAQVALPIPDLELLGRSMKPRGQVIPPAALYVKVRDERLELRAHGFARRIRLLACPAGAPSILGDPLAMFAFPRHFGGGILTTGDRAHSPRVTCGRVVLARERWRLPVDRLARGAAGDDAEDFAAAQRLRCELDLPNPVYAKVPAEPKPIYVDWDSPILVRQLMRMARADGSRIDISEMLPGPADLWLGDGADRYTSELRCTAFSRGER